MTHIRARSMFTYALGVIALLVSLIIPDTRGEAQGPQVTLIVHPDNPVASLTRQQVEAFFLGRARSWSDGTAVEPVDQEPSSAVRAIFSERVMNRSVAAIESHWRQQIFSGRGVPPPRRPNDRAVAGYVLGHRGAIGYVTPGTNVGNARIVRLTGRR